MGRHNGLEMIYLLFYSPLIRFVTSLYSRLGAERMGNPYPDRHSRRLVNKAPRGAHILTLLDMRTFLLCVDIKSSECFSLPLFAFPKRLIFNNLQNQVLH